MSDRSLSRLLFWIGVGTMTAFGAAVMPMAWMIEIADWMGVELPARPVVGYLARHLSLLYGMVGVMFVVLSRDVSRYRPLVRHLAMAAIAFGVAQAAIDIYSHMPPSYTAAESISTIAGGGLLRWTSRHATATPSEDESL